jgi:hypothetical protein
MSGTTMASGAQMVIAPNRSAVSGLRPKLASEDHDQLEPRIEQLDLLARDAAARGEIQTSAQLILKAMDCERRLASRGPQILQLIKPRT